MADKTSIEWADATWNPVVGCSIVSPGCTNCYAMGMAARIQRMTPGSHYAGTTQDSKAGPVWTGKMVLAPDKILTQPLRWARPRRIFVNSMGDLFHPDVAFETIAGVFGIMNAARRHTMQVLTKRSDRMRAFFEWLAQQTEHKAAWVKSVNRAEALCEEPKGGRRSETHPAECVALHAFAKQLVPDLRGGMYVQWPLPNVWLGVSAEDQRRADERVPDLLATPAAVRFVSAEPLIGPIDFRAIDVDGESEVLPLGGAWLGRPEYEAEYAGQKLDQIIVGGESGPGARPMHPDWARSIRDQCEAAGVAFFFKQWGEWSPGPFEEDTPENLRLRLGNRAYVWPDHSRMGRVGKVGAGRLLDGREHNGVPSSITRQGTMQDGGQT